MILNIVKPSFMSDCSTSQPRVRSRAVFIDEDATLLGDEPCRIDPGARHFTLGTGRALRLLGALEYRLIVVGSRSRAGAARCQERGHSAVEARLGLMFADCGAALGGFFWCPHISDPARHLSCLCRRPMPGLLNRAAIELGIDMAGSWMVGDLLDDVEAGRRAGCRTILLSSGQETCWQAGPHRSPHYMVRGLADAAQVIAASRHTRTARRELEDA